MKPTIIRITTAREQRITHSALSNLPLPKIVFLFMLTLSYAAGAGDPQAFDIPWYTIDGGGGTFEGRQFTVSGTIGQPDAGVMTGGGFELSGGFWAAATVVQLPGDCEHDGDVDLDDYACFFACALGPGQGLLPDCAKFDLDDDGDVDIADYSYFETQFKGPS